MAGVEATGTGMLQAGKVRFQEGGVVIRCRCSNLHSRKDTQQPTPSRRLPAGDQLEPAVCLGPGVMKAGQRACNPGPYRSMKQQTGHNTK